MVEKWSNLGNVMWGVAVGPGSNSCNPAHKPTFLPHRPDSQHSVAPPGMGSAQHSAGHIE